MKTNQLSRQPAYAVWDAALRSCWKERDIERKTHAVISEREKVSVPARLDAKRMQSTPGHGARLETTAL
jgi:hypothetical protein